MHLKKRLIAVAALLMMTGAVFWGSTIEMPGEGEETVIQSWFDRKETIYFWYFDESMTNFINSAAVEFGERENVHVIPVLTSANEYPEALNQASVKNEQLPDAYIIGHDSLEKVYLSGLATEIDDVERVCNEANFPAAALDSVIYHGKPVAYPLFFETSALIYNETYLAQWAGQAATKELSGVGTTEDGEYSDEVGEVAIDETLLAQKTEEYFANAVPATVDDILQVADSYDVPEGVEGIMKWDVSDIFFNYWIVGNYMRVGGDTGDDSSDINIENAETMKCLEVYKALNQFFFIEPDTVNYESVIQDFIDGKMVFTIATTDVVARLEKAKQEGALTFDYGIAMMPDVSDELKSRSMSVTNVVAINGYSPNQEIANKFAAYLVDECADSLYEMTGRVSANLHADKDNDALQIFKLEYAESISLPKMMETGNCWMLLERLFSKVWSGEDINAYIQELKLLLSFQTDQVQ